MPRGARTTFPRRSLRQNLYDVTQKTKLTKLKTKKKVENFSKKNEEYTQ